MYKFDIDSITIIERKTRRSSETQSTLCTHSFISKHFCDLLNLLSIKIKSIYTFSVNHFTGA